MRVGALRPAPDTSTGFDYLSVKALPAVAGCYALTNASGDILYVGQAISLRERLCQHLDAGRHRVLTPCGRASFAWVLLVERAATLNAHERGWLNQCELADGTLPPMNRVAAPI